MRETLYVAMQTIDGQPTILGELGVARIGRHWFATSFLNGKRHADKPANDRAQAESYCRQMADYANEAFAKDAVLSGCRYRRVGTGVPDAPSGPVGIAGHVDDTTGAVSFEAHALERIEVGARVAVIIDPATGNVTLRNARSGSSP